MRDIPGLGARFVILSKAKNLDILGAHDKADNQRCFAPLNMTEDVMMVCYNFALRKFGKLRPVQSLATPQKPADTLLVSGRQFSARLALPLLFFGALWFVLCRQLSGEWLVNEQYNYGWFVPFFALYLFWLRWQDRPASRSQKSEVRSQKSEVGCRIHRHSRAFSPFAGSSF